MIDKLIHAYFGVDTETLWSAVKDDIPPLKQTIKKHKNNKAATTPALKRKELITLERF